jgi:DNA-binding transcriptional regulator YiaG
VLGNGEGVRRAISEPEITPCSTNTVSNGVFYWQDNESSKQGSLRTNDRKAAAKLLHVKDEAHRLPPNPAIRKKWGASQAIFADILNVPTKTYISWESGYKNPSGAALKLLMIAKEKPEALLLPECFDEKRPSQIAFEAPSVRQPRREMKR